MSTRLDDILAGRTSLPQWKVERYREIYGKPAPKAKTKRPLVLAESETFQKFPCIHRVRTTEQYSCRPCAGSRIHTICECTLLNRRCTVRASDAWDLRGPRKQRVLCCLSCDLREA